MKTQVNGQTVEGPVIVFRQWQLRGFAIWPYGADPDSSIVFGIEDADRRKGFGSSVTSAEFVTVAPPPARPSPREPIGLGRQFLTAFGEQGAIWFAEGKTFSEAEALFAARERRVAERVKSDADRAQVQLSCANAGMSNGMTRFAASLRMPRSQCFAETGLLSVNGRRRRVYCCLYLRLQ